MNRLQQLISKASFSHSADKHTALELAGKQDVVPGAMRCAKCEFRVQRMTMYTKSGTVGAGDNKTEPCPNGCGPLWPVTWEQEARELYKRLEEMHSKKETAP